MFASHNEAVVRRLIDEVWHKRNFAVVDDLIAPSHTHNDPNAVGLGNGCEGYKALIKLYTNAFPDLHITLEQIVTQGEVVATRWTMTGTHRGELCGVAPTEKRVSVPGMTMTRVSGGKIVDTRTVWDALGLMQQLGVTHQTAQATS